MMFMVRDKPRWASTTRRTSQVTVRVYALCGFLTLPHIPYHTLRLISYEDTLLCLVDVCPRVQSPPLLPVRVNREPRVTHNAQPTCDRVYPRNKPRQSPISFIETTPQRAPHAAEHSRRQAQAFYRLVSYPKHLRAGRQTAALPICA